MKSINRIFVALMVVLSVFAVQSCGGSQQNGSADSSVSADKPTPQQIVDEAGINLPLNMGEGLVMSKIEAGSDILSLTIYIPSPVSIDEFKDSFSYDDFLASLRESYAKNEDVEPADLMTRKAIDNGYDLAFVFDNTEDSVEYKYTADQIKK